MRPPRCNPSPRGLRCFAAFTRRLLRRANPAQDVRLSCRPDCSSWRKLMPPISAPGEMQATLSRTASPDGGNGNAYIVNPVPLSSCVLRIGCRPRSRLRAGRILYGEDANRRAIQSSRPPRMPTIILLVSSSAAVRSPRRHHCRRSAAVGARWLHPWQAGPILASLVVVRSGVGCLPARQR